MNSGLLRRSEKLALEFISPSTAHSSSRVAIHYLLTDLFRRSIVSLGNRFPRCFKLVPPHLRSKGFLLLRVDRVMEAVLLGRKVLDLAGAGDL